MTVLRRCYSTLLPTSTSYISTHLSPFPDLYGPFWTLTTLILTLFLSSSLAQSVTSYLSQTGNQYDYDFTLLSVAVTLVYVYGLVVPVGLWLVLRWIGVGEWSIVEAVALWGYGQFVWIPVSVSDSSTPITNYRLVQVALRHTNSNCTMDSGWHCIWFIRLFSGHEHLPHSCLGTSKYP